MEQYYLVQVFYLYQFVFKFDDGLEGVDFEFCVGYFYFGFYFVIFQIIKFIECLDKKEKEIKLKYENIWIVIFFIEIIFFSLI